MESEQGDVVESYNYWGYQVYVVVTELLADEQPITVNYSSGGNTEGIVILMSKGKWDVLVALGSMEMFLQTTRVLAQSYIQNKLVRFN